MLTAINTRVVDEIYIVEYFSNLVGPSSGFQLPLVIDCPINGGPLLKH